MIPELSVQKNALEKIVPAEIVNICLKCEESWPKFMHKTKYKNISVQEYLPKKPSFLLN